MKKFLLLIPVLLVIFLVHATPVLAYDPPDMDVDIGIDTPGDVDLDVNVSAGGDVEVTVDGVDFKQTARMAREAYSKATAPTNFLWDYSYYWQISGIGPGIEREIAELQELAKLLLDAEAKLIQEHELTKDELSAIRTAVSSLDEANAEVAAALDSLDAETSVALDSLRERDEEIWNQLMYGAEAHLASLEEVVVEQGTRIAELQAQIDTLSTDNANLYAYVDYLQKWYLYYFQIGCGVVAALGAGLLSLLVVVLRRRAA